MPPVGLKSTISAGEWPQTYALDRAATGTGMTSSTYINHYVGHYVFMRHVVIIFY